MNGRQSQRRCRWMTQPQQRKFRSMVHTLSRVQSRWMTRPKRPKRRKFGSNLRVPNNLRRLFHRMSRQALRPAWRCLSRQLQWNRRRLWPRPSLKTDRVTIWHETTSLVQLLKTTPKLEFGIAVLALTLPQLSPDFVYYSTAACTGTPPPHVVFLSNRQIGNPGTPSYPLLKVVQKPSRPQTQRHTTLC